MPQVVLERRTAAEAISAGASAGLINVTVITPGVGSSGYYSQDVLEAAGTDAVFPAGTLMFLDHPSETEAYERPERSVRDVAGVFTTPATWNGTALAAEARLFGPWQETLTEMADAIGVSIRASAVVSEGEHDGRRMPIVDKLVHGESVDFVTRAGRGGSFAALEAARPTLVCERAVAHGVAEATANDTRDALQSVIRDRFGSVDDDAPWVWVRDFDDSTVWFEVSDTTYQIGYALAGDGSASLDDGDPTEVTARTTYVPVGSADGGSTTTSTSESREGTVGNIQVDEAEHRRLTEAAAASAAATQRAEAAEARADEAERRNALTTARDSARPIAAEVVNASESLTPSARARVIETTVAGLVVNDAGTFDEAAFRTAVETARTAAEAEIAEALQAAGVGSVRNSGTGGGGDGHTVTREESDAARAKAFGRTVTESKGA